MQIEPRTQSFHHPMFGLKKKKKRDGKKKIKLKKIDT